ncbi:Uncharacterized protein YpuA, DUF1002 family [Melghirimyces thermohalophilus]|uniref:Uncharacterized protein YpuA, DUF1002 family n=1 Tax=Melghirimyces thermohalophilus TaxID=1236220 RepID=A0A1G6HTQ0_9BACL|nr:DUF1002 domain-containing protein [Melghirimyces thermohalophilus]SDB97612.1 Uncharacterized protein YpuA, DUF1002 family [Melghirimyces thermohalophilus]
MKKGTLLALIGLFMLAAVLPQPVSADAVTGETVVTLGADLTPAQEQSVRQEFGVDANVESIEVGIEDIQQYLHGKSSTTSGSAGGDNKAYSSAKITLTDSGNGINVQANNVTQVTEQMYANALLTAGVQDADVQVTSPKPVTGTAALTGIMMAFEKAADQQISQEQRQVANEEMKQTSQLGQKIGDKEKAAQFMTQVKDEIANKQPKSEEEVRDIIVNVAGDLNINLNDQDIQNITQVMFQFSQLNIDWDSLGNQLEKLKGSLGELAQSEEAQGFFDKILAWLSDLFSSLKSS